MPIAFAILDPTVTLAIYFSILELSLSSAVAETRRNYHHPITTK